MRLTRVQVLAAAGVLLTAGCANFAPMIPKDEKPTGKEAYLYGRFYMNAPAAKLSMEGHQTMGFTLKCANEKTYTIKFDRSEPLRVVKIEPSSCTLDELVYTDADGRIKSRKPAPATLKKTVAYDAGKAYYLGDYYAEASSTVAGNTIYSNWRVTNVSNDYRNTTDKLKMDFPNLAEIPTENRMIGR